MPLTRERPRTPAFLPPAPLPSLRDALQRRTAIFGPFDTDPAPVVPHGALLSGADARDVPVVGVRKSLGIHHARIVDGARPEIGHSVMVLGEDVPGAADNATLRLALDHDGQEAITPARQLRLSGGVRHALVVALCHGGRLLDVGTTSDIRVGAFRAGRPTKSWKRRVANFLDPVGR